ncbi:putative T7SS-secreted protein [Streptomyces albidus (ex Kaewkla and Franco 2022)]|uniref:putative T7SS-secreted protein n=1 Tax=Streptomyces albidus (ex Kaewkla and Franco 2022) TaxID=722709 RepID=UPI0015EECA3F|nr:DUF6531 domain-containing protein [Streptomyces albidus (ex Kaewkla and Franco 2022)]
MTSRDAMEGGTQERIPPHSEPGDVIFGNPGDVDDLVRKLRAYSGAFKDGRDQLDVLEMKDWSGEGAGAFERATEKLPKELASAHKYFSAAANALDAYADKLRSVQKRCRPLIEDADEARAASKRHWKKVTAYNDAVDRKDDVLPERPPEDDPGIAAMNACHARLDKLEAELQGVVDAAKGKLDKAAEKAPDKPEGWDAVKQKGSDFVDGFKDGVSGILEGFEPLADADFKGVGMQLAGVVDGAAYAAEHPKEFAKAAVNWDEWSRNPSRAAGQLTPDVLLALASGGTGALRRGGAIAKEAAQRLKSREKGLGRDGSARDRADDDPEKHDKCDGEKCKAGEPIDVATGEMVMSATDVSLPGVMPLTLTRNYVSGHPCGGWFGRTWAATLDQRLELDDSGIVYISDDGMLLTYPVPEPDVPTMPTSGPSWPLCWDGKPDGTMTLTVPEEGRTLTFAPLPAGGPELALREITDRNGQSITIGYEAGGAPQEIVHSGGYRIGIDTDPALLRITALRLLNTGAGKGSREGTTLVSFGYNAAGDLTEVINSTGEPLRYAYDDEHRITSWTDRNGTTFAYVYDHRGRVLRTVGPDGMMSGRFHYDTAARTTTYTDSFGNRTSYVYNEAYKVISETDPLGHTTRTEWDETNRLRTAVTDPAGRTTRYTYDEGRLTAVELPDGSMTTADYNDLGLPEEIREANGATWHHTYTHEGNRTSTTDPRGAETRYDYDDLGHLTSVTDALGHTTTLTTDAAGLPLTVTDPLGHTTRVSRGPHGRITALTDPLGHTTRQGWTIEGKPAWRELPDGARETWQWDGEGNLVTHTDRAGNTTEYTHTHFDLPASRTDPDGARYAFAYDTELRLAEVTNPQGRQWRYDYDATGRLVSETDFNGATRTYEVSATGQLLAQTNAMGETLRFAHDPLGRPVEQHDEATGEVTTYAYGPTGDLLGAANADAEITLERDLLGRILSETVNGATTSYAYDAIGRRTCRTTPSGLTSTWTYDEAGRPASLGTDHGTLTFAYDAGGRETQRHIDGVVHEADKSTGVTLAQDWDATGRLTTQTLHSPAEELLQHRSYRYRPDGYVTEIRELTSGTRHFELDPVGRVTGVQAHGWTETYAYDTVGNQTQAAAPDHPSPGERAHDGTLLLSAGRTTYTHDAAGRMTRKTRKLLNGQTRSWAYTWNAQDRLTTATTPDGELWTYTYDPLGRRISKTGSNGSALTFIWDGTRLAEQATPDGATLTWDYAPGTHRPLTQTNHTSTKAQSGTSLLAGLEDPASVRFHAILTDLTGTPTELVTADGRITWQHRTTLWGTQLPAPAGEMYCPLRFPGQYHDPETGLHYNYFRYYDPETARYITPDPLGLTPAPNHHTYVHNPQTWADPLGLMGCEPPAIDETRTGKGSIVSKHPMTSDEALAAGKDFLGDGYKELGTNRGVFRSADGLRQFRMDQDSLDGNHWPHVPHVHFEIFENAGDKKARVNNHVPLED